MKNNEIIKILEEVEYKGLKFTVELDYYYDDELKEYLLDEELGNSNLKKNQKRVYKEVE